MAEKLNRSQMEDEPTHSQKAMEQNFRRLFSVLMVGNRNEVKTAKKDLEQLLHRERKAFQKSAAVALEYLPQFEQIKGTENQAALASGLGLFFLVLADEHLDTLKNFVLKVIQHPDGRVREAIRKTADWLYASLSSRVMPFVYPEGTKLSEQQEVMQRMGREQYLAFVAELDALIEKYNDESEDAEYIEDMKPSVNKSLQLLWSRLIDSPVYQNIVHPAPPVPIEILLKRKDIERDIVQMLIKIDSSFSLEDIKDIIYHENDNDDFQKLIMMFDHGGDASELDNILELVTDAWNYFPHQSLDGLSPTEKIQENREIEEKGE